MEEETVQRKVKAGQLKKRALKNKALGVSFNEKDLKDYVTGFHKRKKKRRKEAQKQQNEALRRKRNEERKKRKLEREFVHHGGVPPTEIDECQEEEAPDQHQSVAETKTYENDDLKVTVVTSEINPEEESNPSERKVAAVAPDYVVGDKRKEVPISNKKSFKKVAKHRSRPRPASKRDKKKGKKRGKK